MYQKVSISEIMDENNSDTEILRDIFRWFLLRYYNIELKTSINRENHSIQEFVKLMEEYSNKLMETSQFRYTQLINWLIDNHRPFIEEYRGSKIPRNYRTHSKRSYVKQRLQNLEELGIIKTIGKVESRKNKTQTDLYSLTIYGLVTTFTYVYGRHYRTELTTKVNSRGQVVTDNEKIYEFEKTALERQRRLLVDFWMYLFFITESSLSYFLIDFIAHAVTDFNSFRDFFLMLLDNYFTNNLRKIRGYFLLLNSKDPAMYNYFLKTLEKLDEDIRVQFLIQLKSDTESNLANNRFKLPEDWEETRLNYINDCRALIVIGQCHKCDSEQTLKINVYEFLDLEYFYNKETSETQCNCKEFYCVKCQNNELFFMDPYCYYFYDYNPPKPIVPSD